jgi:hypothetical protein
LKIEARGFCHGAEAFMQKGAGMADDGASGVQRAFGRNLADFGTLSAAERRLIDACRKGEWCELSDERPTEGNDANRIRAELIRFLALFGDAQTSVHDHGVRLRGAWVEGVLDLDDSTDVLPLFLNNCYLVNNILASRAKIATLSLQGSRILSLIAHGIKIADSLLLRRSFHAAGPVELIGAKIQGTLSCIKGRFENPKGNALIADRIKVAGGLFMSDGFHATGAVRLLGAEIGGDLDCVGGHFENPNGDALNFQTAYVSGGFLFYDLNVVGGVNLASMHCGDLVDKLISWPNGQLILDGFCYGRLTSGPTDAKSRIFWLHKQKPKFLDVDFCSQPWEQLIKVLREMGHKEDAAEVAIAKQEALRKAGKIKGIKSPLHWLYGVLIGYGYRPLRTIAWMIGIWFFCSVYFYFAANGGLIAPANPVLHTHSSVAACGVWGDVNPDRYWTNCTAMPAAYTTFQPWLYSLDLILPLVNLQQDADWAPVVSNSKGQTLTAGVVTRWLMWFEILFGWMASLMLVAVLGRLVEKD